MKNDAPLKQSTLVRPTLPDAVSDAVSDAVDSVSSVSNVVPSTGYSPHRIFFCPEETYFYSQCLEKMVLGQCSDADIMVEFGAGDGSAVIHSLLRTSFKGVIHGYELSSTACRVACAQITQHGLGDRYKIHNRCFFEGVSSTEATCLIANPPYLPAPDNRILMPELHGGIDGATITQSLLTVGCAKVLLMISAYSNPVDTIHHALTYGYQVVDFMVTPLKFGYYSSEPKVKNWIVELRSQQKAFYSPNIYLLAGVLFQKDPHASVDLSDELLTIITAL